MSAWGHIAILTEIGWASHLGGFRNNLRPVILFHDQPNLSRGGDDIDDIPNALVSTITS